MNNDLNQLSGFPGIVCTVTITFACMLIRFDRRSPVFYLQFTDPNKFFFMGGYQNKITCHGSSRDK